MMPIFHLSDRVGAKRFALSLVVFLLAGLPPAVGQATATFDLPGAVREAATEAAAARFEGPDRFELLSARFGGADPVPRDRPVDLDLTSLEGPSSSGVISVHFRMSVAGIAHGNARATLRGKVYGPALVATQPLARGAVIEPGSVVIKEMDITRYGNSVLRDPADLIGVVPTRTLGREQVLTRQLLQPEPVVRRGDEVDLRVIGPGYQVTARGIALVDGVAGERIAAKNSMSGTRLTGEVQPDGSLLVFRRARNLFRNSGARTRQSTSTRGVRPTNGGSP